MFTLVCLCQLWPHDVLHCSTVELSQAVMKGQKAAAFSSTFMFYYISLYQADNDSSMSLLNVILSFSVAFAFILVLKCHRCECSYE